MVLALHGNDFWKVLIDAIEAISEGTVLMGETAGRFTDLFGSNVVV